MSNVFIIGPENAGKTVLTTMLGKFLSENPHCGILFTEEDIQTKQHTNKELVILKNGEWPSSTKEGSLLNLNWKWAVDDFSILVTLIDPSGQGIRAELCGETNKLNICQTIENANMIILVIDLIGHYSETYNEKKVENGFIVESVLRKVKPNQKILLILTKADELEQYRLPTSEWANKNKLISLITNLMPEANLNGHLSTIKKLNCKIFAVLSVDTENVDTGIRKPILPLRSKGFEALTKEILHYIKSEKELVGKVNSNKPKSLYEQFCDLLFGLFIIVLVMVILALIIPLFEVLCDYLGKRLFKKW